MVTALTIEMAFFDGDLLLSRCKIEVCNKKQLCKVQSQQGHSFEITHEFGFPSSPIEIICFSTIGMLYKSALRVGVHTSEDWETVSLGNIHTMAFKCYEDLAT